LLQGRAAQVKRVVILGAGFSRAISDQIPLTDELGTLVMEKLDEPRYEFSDGYFEMWLSRLAEAQPDLWDHQNYENYAKFLRIADAVHAVIVERQLHVMGQEPPYCLMRLVGVMQAWKMTAITFNYDTLLEKAVAARRWLDWDRGMVVSTADIIDGLPPSVAGAAPGPDPVESFRLLKLHGSIDSYWVSGDSTGATINRWESVGYWGAPEEPDLRRRQRELPGRVPFIVPPASGKSAFYSNPLTRELWQRAAAALTSADTVTLVGYSLPATDLVTSGMLAERLAKTPTRVEVVNRSSEAVVERLKRLGISKDVITSIGGNDAVDRFVDQIEAEASRSVVPVLTHMEDNPLLLVAGDEHRVSAVIRVEHSDHVIRLITEEPSDLNQTIHPGHARESPPLSLNDLRAGIQGDSPKTLVAVLDGGLECRIVDHQKPAAFVPAGDGEWLVLSPAAAPTGAWGWRP
jgi:hypothetical protein